MHPGLHWCPLSGGHIWGMPWAYLFGLAWLGMATVHYIAVFYTRKIFFGEGRRDFIFEQNADLHKYVRHMMK
jgi:hypothetical protein